MLINLKNTTLLKILKGEVSKKNIGKYLERSYPPKEPETSEINSSDEDPKNSTKESEKNSSEQNLEDFEENIIDKDRKENSIGGTLEKNSFGNLTVPFAVKEDEENQILPSCITGFPNLGNTCFANALLQCLYHIPEFKKQLFQTHQQLQKQEKRNTSFT